MRPTVKIGLVAPFEGRYRYVGYDVIYAARLALQEANRDGGVSGYGVELVAYDDGAEPAMAVEQARKLDVDTQVLGALGHFRDTTTKAVVSTYTDAGLPLVAPAALASELSAAPMFYAPGPPADELADPLLDRAQQRASDGEIVLVGDEGPLTVALHAAAQGRRLGLPFVSGQSSDWHEQLLAHDPAVLLCDLEPVRAGEVISALRKGGWEGEVVGGPALAASDFVAVAGPSAAGATFLTPWPFPAHLPGGEAFVAAYVEISGGTKPGPYALPAYRAAWRLVEALEVAAADGPPTRQAVASALLDLEGQTVLGGMEVGGEAGSRGAELFWYRIGADGAPSLMRRESTSEVGSPLVASQRRAARGTEPCLR